MCEGRKKSLTLLEDSDTEEQCATIIHKTVMFFPAVFSHFV
jgi:hypothetical protein